MRAGITSFSVFWLLIVSVAAGAAGLYKIVDEKGNVTYTDQPPADSKTDEVKLKPINSVPAVRPTKKISPETSVEFSGYSVASVASPRPDQIVSNEQLNLVVQLTLEPQLQEGHLVQFIYDGSPRGTPVAATSYAIGDLYRGAHSVSAQVIDATGAVLIAAPPVTFHVQRQFVRPQTGQ